MSPAIAIYHHGGGKITSEEPCLANAAVKILGDFMKPSSEWATVLYLVPRGWIQQTLEKFRPESVSVHLLTAIISVFSAINCYSRRNAHHLAFLCCSLCSYLNSIDIFSLSLYLILSPFAVSLPKWPQWPRLVYFEARNLELHLGLPNEWHSHLSHDLLLSQAH